MAEFEEYSQKYSSIRMERRKGILQITFHTNGDTLQWDLGGPGSSHKELCPAFNDIATDPKNKIVIMTGAGNDFSGPRATPGYRRKHFTARKWDKLFFEGRHLLMNLLNIEVPMISAINGPALRHSELPLLCDIVLAAEHATFQDTGHYVGEVVPGDGLHIVYPHLLGLNRGRYFLLTGQTLSAQKALELGLVSEVLSRENLLPRAWELAEQLVKRPPLVLRYSRVLLTQHLKQLMQGLLGYGLALEGLGMLDEE